MHTLTSVLSPTLLASVLLVATAAPARSVLPPMRVGTVPDDLREVAGARDTTGLMPLKAFEHRPWLTGSSVAFLPGERFAVVADTENGAVQVVEVATGVVHKRIAVGRRPERLVVGPKARVYVTNRGSRTVSVLDVERGVEVRSVDAGVEPFGLALTADARRLLVTSSATGELLAFDAERMALLFRVPTGADWPAAVAAHPDGKRAYVTHMLGGRVAIVDVARGQVVGTLALPTSDTGLPSRLLGRRSAPRVPNQAFAAVVSPGGTRLHVAHMMVDTGSTRAASLAVGGYGVGAEAPIVSTVSTFDLDSGSLVRPEPKFDIPNGTQAFQQRDRIQQADFAVQSLAQPIALAADPKRARLLLAAHGSDRVMALDSSSADPIGRPDACYATKEAPEGIAVASDGSFAVVHNAQGFSVSVIRLAAHAQDTTRWALPAERTFEVAKSPLPADARRGQRLFTFALDARVGGGAKFACASCHPDGRQDGLVWRIGAGPRQTPILADRLEGTAPFNWIGTEDKLFDNVRQTIRRLGGTGLPDVDIQALATYCERYMPGFDNPHRTTQSAALVAEGKVLFESTEVGCATCHDAARKLTDGLRHDVGTTTPIEIELWKRFEQQPPAQPQANITLEPLPKAPVAYDTPSLRHLWASGPYFHDGSVRTIRELVTSGNPGNRMGQTSQLSRHQRDSLVAYLETL